MKRKDFLVAFTLAFFAVTAAYAQTADEFMKSGRAALDRRDYNKAIADLTESIRLRPYYYAYLLRAIAYNRGDFLGGNPLALADFSEAIRLNPNYAHSYYSRGIMYNQFGEKDSALADFTRYLHFRPNDADAYYERAYIYLRDKKDYDRAVADFTKAIQLSTDNARIKHIYVTLLNHYSNIKDFNGFITMCNQMASKFPNDFYLFNVRGSGYLRMDEYDRAIAEFNESIRLDPNAYGVYDNRGLAWYKKGDYKQARADVNRALQLMPDNLNAKDLDAELKKKGY